VSVSTAQGGKAGLKHLVPAPLRMRLGGLRTRIREQLERYPFPHLERLIEEYDRGSAAEVLYFGDSVVERVSRDDRDSRTLGEMTAAALAGRKCVLCLSHSAFHMGVFRHLCGAVLRMRRQPKMVVLPVNLRSLSPQWDLNPEWQFDEEIAALKRYAAAGGAPRIRRITPGPKAFREFYDTPIRARGSDFKTVGEFRRLIAEKPEAAEERRLRSSQIFAFHYLCAIGRDHRRLSQLDETLRVLSERGVRVLAYSTPVNYEAGVRFCGPVFESTVRENAETVAGVVNRYADTRLVSWSDWTCSLSSRRFFHDDCATEHLNENGRRELADWIAGEVRASRE